MSDAERRRLKEDAEREKNWKRWGPYLAERQWGTVREDYSADGDVWDYFTHDDARSRAYRWGEDGLLGFTDRECRLCFSVALWNEKDTILKERLFGLSGNEGNHGEDVKELYYYLDSLPTHTYAKALYKYPQAAFPYDDLVSENARRDKTMLEYEILDTGVFDNDAYFDVQAEYAKESPNDILIRLTITNHNTIESPLHILPTLWFRNTWVWGCTHEGCGLKPHMSADNETRIRLDHETLNRFYFEVSHGPNDIKPQLIFTDNETNTDRLFKTPNNTQYVKDAFHDFIINGDHAAINPKKQGTKAAAWYRLSVPPKSSIILNLRLYSEEETPTQIFGNDFDKRFEDCIEEADTFYSQLIAGSLSDEERIISRQAYAGLLWSKQFYHYVVKDWLQGDPNMPGPPAERKKDTRNRDWPHVFSRDVLSMPDKWEYPWFAAWDLAFHMIPFSQVDPEFSKYQLEVLLREWYMHPNGQIPAYEFAFGDVNPPVHAWACWHVFHSTAPRGKRDRAFLARSFQKLLMNFTWWVNRKDPHGDNLFSGGFLGLDNIGVFDRSRPLPHGDHLNQADGTAWMGFYAAVMLGMGLELASTDVAYEDLASKFFEHFVAIIDAINSFGGSGLWDEEDQFYYDQLLVDGSDKPLRIRSLVGLIPLIAVLVIDSNVIQHTKGFRKRMNWFIENRPELSRHITKRTCPKTGNTRYLLAIPPRERLESILRYMLDEDEFLSPFGIRSMSKVHAKKPFTLKFDDTTYRVDYEPGESRTALFGGNSNWRGPIWLPINYLIIQALQRYERYYGDDFLIECPTNSGNMLTFGEVAIEIQQRLTKLFLKNKNSIIPCLGHAADCLQSDSFQDLHQFYEYFHGDTGRGLGASHQTGWTALITNIFHNIAEQRSAPS
ncbi:Mannosyl oligosaccharide glucosidase [Poriferisphaera corsica]|uniref:Mannosyl oligosaccharide glucosidase n=1 Tax=Poriferisphaera corsica TaxID=2528020 RepID=A0A517YS63_9BACT|nr:glucosidase [Poriferisphaera corsica]QDU33077.1 Mannosyl oligosaccharide glucosidase [Poriferisphaera corsica]